MKVLKICLMLSVLLTLTWSAEAQKKGEKTVVFHVHLDCMSCKAKVEKNLPYEKGVKDLNVDMKAQTVTVTFREDKNSVENLQNAIEKMHVEVKKIENGEAQAENVTKGKKTVVFHVHLDCESCKAKVEKNLPFEKGVKDLHVDMKAQTITVTFLQDKNTEENLRAALKKMHVEVKDCCTK